MHQAILVDLVVVEQRAARRFADADALELVDPGVGTQPVREQVGVVDRLRDPLDAGQDLDQPGVVVQER